MEIIEIVPGVQFPNAVELPNKNRRFVNGTNKSSSGNSGGGKHKDRIVVTGKALTLIQEGSREQTKANQKILVLDGTGKRHWHRLADWQAAA